MSEEGRVAAPIGWCTLELVWGSSKNDAFIQAVKPHLRLDLNLHRQHGSLPRRVLPGSRLRK